MTHMDIPNPYFGAFVMFVLTFGAFIATIFLARLVSRKLSSLNTERLKSELYECGPAATKQPNMLSPQFYLMALLFILFDVEIIFMFPWAIDYKLLGVFGLVEMLLFILLLTIGFVYAWKKGAFEWHSMK